MRQRAEEAEAVITAKLDEDFTRALADPSLAAGKASFGRTTATRLAALPGHPGYNKARGFNSDDLDQLDDICAFFTDLALPPLIEVWAGDASASLGRRLAQAGFYAAEVNATLHAPPRQPPTTTSPEPGLEIREVATGEDDTVYLDTLLNGYALSTGAGSPQQTMMAIEHRSPHLRRYVAYVDDHPAAAAARYSTRRSSYLAGAATIPAMRNRGCQSALIRRRLHDAAATAQQVVVTTAFNSPSQANLHRLGFTITHTRALWRPLTAAERPG
jgi:ribosomal protein S18 acetylase RimI-like enzyme